MWESGKGFPFLRQQPEDPERLLPPRHGATTGWEDWICAGVFGDCPPSYPLFEQLREVGQGPVHGDTDSPDFEYIQGALPRFIFANKRLRLTDRTGEVRLPHARLDAQVTQ
jgi:hypothetical protein